MSSTSLALIFPQRLTDLSSKRRYYLIEKVNIKEKPCPKGWGFSATKNDTGGRGWGGGLFSILKMNPQPRPPVSFFLAFFVVEFDLYILAVISEGLAKKGKATAVCSVFRHGECEVDIAVVIDIQVPYSGV